VDVSRQYVPGNAQHVGARREQQDAFGFSDPTKAGFLRHSGFLAVLADGVGGLAQGAQASRCAVQRFLAVYQDKTEHEPVGVALERSLREANAAVRSLAVASGAPGNVATTLVGAALGEGGLEWISVGDSALYLYRAGLLSRLNHLHVAPSEATSSRPEFSDVLTSFLGDDEIAAVDASPAVLALHAGDRIVLASDGLYKTLSLAEIGAELQAPPQQACEVLVSRTLERRRPTQDNVTVLCVEVADVNDGS
jgi:protein phosphatase